MALVIVSFTLGYGFQRGIFDEIRNAAKVPVQNQAKRNLS